jgi:hypothetical protein
MRSCPGCGSSLADDAVFCPICGRRATSAATQGAPPPVAANEPAFVANGPSFVANEPAAAVIGTATVDTAQADLPQVPPLDEASGSDPESAAPTLRQALGLLLGAVCLVCAYVAGRWTIGYLTNPSSLGTLASSDMHKVFELVCLWIVTLALLSVSLWLNPGVLERFLKSGLLRRRYGR